MNKQDFYNIIGNPTGFNLNPQQQDISVIEAARTHPDINMGNNKDKLLNNALVIYSFILARDGVNDQNGINAVKLHAILCSASNSLRGKNLGNYSNVQQYMVQLCGDFDQYYQAILQRNQQLQNQRQNQGNQNGWGNAPQSGNFNNTPQNFLEVRGGNNSTAVVEDTTVPAYIRNKEPPQTAASPIITPQTTSHIPTPVEDTPVTEPGIILTIPQKEVLAMTLVEFYERILEMNKDAHATTDVTLGRMKLLSGTPKVVAKKELEVYKSPSPISVHIEPTGDRVTESIILTVPSVGYNPSVGSGVSFMHVNFESFTDVVQMYGEYINEFINGVVSTDMLRWANLGSKCDSALLDYEEAEGSNSVLRECTNDFVNEIEQYITELVEDVLRTSLSSDMLLDSGLADVVDIARGLIPEEDIEFIHKTIKTHLETGDFNASMSAPVGIKGLATPKRPAVIQYVITPTVYVNLKAKDLCLEMVPGDIGVPLSKEVHPDIYKEFMCLFTEDKANQYRWGRLQLRDSVYSIGFSPLDNKQLKIRYVE